MNISLNQQEARAVIRTLLFLAKVDGDIADQEFAIIKQLKEIHYCQTLNIVEEFKKLPDDIRLILKDVKRKVAKIYLVKLLIHFCYCDGNYSAVERLTICHIAEGLGADSRVVFKIEKDYAHEAQQAIANYMAENPEAIDKDAVDNFTWQNMAMTAGLAVLGGGAMVATAGLLAPVVGGIVGSSLFGLSGAAASSSGLAFLGGGSLAAGGGGMAAGTTVVASALGIGGLGAGTKTGLKLFGGLEEFEIFPLTPGRQACHQLLCIHGFMQQNENLEETWEPILQSDKNSQISGLRWESKTLISWYQMRQQLVGNIDVGTKVAMLGAKATKAAGGLVALPVTIISAFDLISNPWHVACNKAALTGKLLAQHIMKMPSPISLLGYSLGGRVIGYALEHLAKEQCYGKVFDIYFMGGAIDKNHAIFKHHDLKKVVANNIFNCYSRKDLVLTGLYQVAQLGEKPIGLLPIESEDVINLDVSDVIEEHSQYKGKLPILLKRCSAQSMRQQVVVTTATAKTATDQAIALLRETPGMTEAHPRDFHKAKYICHLNDGSLVLRWINPVQVHHIFIASTTGEMIFGGFVGWVHTDGLLATLRKIEAL